MTDMDELQGESASRHLETWEAFDKAQAEAGIAPPEPPKGATGMKVRSLIDGPINGLDNKAVDCKKGDVVEVHVWYGQSLIEAGVAEPIGGAKGRGKKEKPSQEAVEVANVPAALADVLDEKTFSRLDEAGFGSVEAIVAASDDDLTDVKGVGGKTVRAMREALMAEEEEDADA